MPFIKGAMLGKFAEKWTDQHVPENLAKFYVMQLVLAVGYLHRYKILHRDLQMSNLMIDENGYIRLIDFGMAAIF